MIGLRSLLTWYGPRRSAYPWRAHPTPYRVLVSEVMLQQTQIGRVLPAYTAFLARFPTLAALASASPADVVIAWSGLGYNRRAIALRRAAGMIVKEHDGRIPADPDVLRRLPGVGPYTAAAIASVAHGVPVAAVDTNVRRVVARVRLGVEPHEVSPRRLRHAADDWLYRPDPGTWNQAVMDLGRVICRPAPRCEACPLSRHCRFRSRRPAQANSAPRGNGSARTRGRDIRFEGSFRQVRGKVVNMLREASSLSLAELARRSGEPLDRIQQAAAALSADGLIGAGPAALAGRERGRLRLER